MQEVIERLDRIEKELQKLNKRLGDIEYLQASNLKVINHNTQLSIKNATEEIIKAMRAS